MDYVIAILLIVVIVILMNNNNEKDEQKPNKQSWNLGRRPAFTKEEWDMAVTAYYKHDYEQYNKLQDEKPSIMPFAYFCAWSPPEYDEVKYDRVALEKLRIMAGLD